MAEQIVTNPTNAQGAAESNWPSQPVDSPNLESILEKGLANPQQEQVEINQIIDEKISYGTLDLTSDDLRQRAYRAVMDRYDSVKFVHDSLVTKLDQW